MNIERIAAPPATRLPDLTPLDLTCIANDLSPALLEMMGRSYMESASRLRAYGFTGHGEGRA